MGKHQSNEKMIINLGKILFNNTLLEVGYEQTHLKKYLPLLKLLTENRLPKNVLCL